jgi:DedD protein
VIGVIGFPLVFETRPRPIPVEIPIEIPKKDGAPALVMPPARPVVTAPTAAPIAPRDEVITETHADAGREVAARASAPTAAPLAERAASKPSLKAAAAEPARKPASTVASAASGAGTEASRKPAASAPAAAESARARALLDAKPASAAESGRFVVQVGAFAEAEAARDTRNRVEKLGMKTYTQVAQTPAGSRIRVRVGPFATRAEADAALAKARAAGLTAVVLTL